MLPTDLAKKLVPLRPPLIAGGLMGLAFLTHLLPFMRVFEFRIVDVGAVFCLAGLGVLLWAFFLFKQHGNDVLPTAPKAALLLTKGPYIFTRNPMYVGMVVIMLGAAFLFGTLPFFVAAALFYFILNSVHIPFEEHKLENQFGDAYRAYMKHTRRWI